jgi:hypothetical protein
VDVARAQDQALDAYVLFSAIYLEAEARVPEGYGVQGYIPGRQERLGYQQDQPGGRHCGRVRAGLEEGTIVVLV